MTLERWLYTAASLCVAAAVLAVPFAFEPPASMAQEQKPEQQLLRHVVMFQFKDSASEADVKKVVDAFAALPEKIPQIADFEWGTDNSPEGLANGFTHCFLLTFESEADREVYLPHPAHKAFGEILKPHLEKVQVIDYWAKP